MATSDLNLSTIFAPRAVAVIGASSSPGSVAQAVFGNVLQHNYAGVVYSSWKTWLNPDART